jgi:hypothetical protein
MGNNLSIGTAYHDHSSTSSPLRLVLRSFQHVRKPSPRLVSPNFIVFPSSYLASLCRRPSSNCPPSNRSPCNCLPSDCFPSDCPSSNRPSSNRPPCQSLLCHFTPAVYLSDTRQRVNICLRSSSYFHIGFLLSLQKSNIPRQLPNAHCRIYKRTDPLYEQDLEQPSQSLGSNLGDLRRVYERGFRRRTIEQHRSALLGNRCKNSFDSL